jgi:uncharacterized repeat protein (TIGR01451 family)
MMKTTKLLAAASAIALSALAAAPALAAGTTAGSSILNTATVNYQVGGVAQTAVNASNTFVVDRKIALTVAEVGSSTTSVSPGQTAAVTSFTVTNNSNAPLDLGLSVAQPAGGTAAHGGTDVFDVTGVTMYLDNPLTGTVGAYDAGDAVVTFLDEIAADASRTVFVVANVPITAINGQVAGVTLSAQAREAGAATAQGIVVTETVGANTAAMDTSFADTAGATDAVRDGIHSARDDYTVAAAVLTVAKTSRVISDPTGSATPKMIPGAVVEYCIAVTNAPGGATATNIIVTDPLPTETTYSAAFGIFFNATVTGGVCSAGTNPGGAFATGTVTANAMSVAGGATQGVYFRATIN